MSLDTFQLPENLDLTASKTLLEAAGCSPKFIAAYEKESQISFEHLKSIFNKHKDHLSRETAIKRFLRARHAVVFNNFNFFSIPYSPINQLCADLMSAMVKDNELLIQILVPTINNQLTYTTGDELKELTETTNSEGKRILKPHTFIISQNGEGIIPLESWFAYYAEYVKREDKPYHHMYTASDNKLIFLDESEIEQLRHCAKPDSDLFFADMEMRQKIIKNKHTLAGAIYHLCENMRGNSEGGKGSSSKPHDDIFDHIRTFNQILNQLDASVKEKVLAKRASGKNFGEYLNIIAAINPSERAQYSSEDVTTCTFTNGAEIKEILKTNLAFFCNIHLNKNNNETSNVNDEQLFIKQISDKLENRRSGHPQNAIYFYSQPDLNAFESLMPVYKQYLADEHGDLLIEHYEAVVFYQKLYGASALKERLKKIPTKILRTIFDGAVAAKDENIIVSVLDTGVKLRDWFNQRFLSQFLLMAVESRWLIVSKELLQRNDLYFDEKNVESKNILHLASEYGLTEIVNMILNKKTLAVDLKANFYNGEDSYSALGFAAMNGHIEIVNALIAAGANYKSDTILLNACANQHFQVVERLLDLGANPNAKNEIGTSAMHYLAQYGQEELMKKFISKNACINELDNYSMTPLLHAVQSKQSRCVAILISNGADVNLFNETRGSRFTALHHAVRVNDIESARSLIDAGAMLSPKDSDGWTPLHFAANKGNLDMVKLLCQHKVDLYAVAYTKNQGSALELALYCDHVEVANYLLNLINYQAYYQMIKQRKFSNYAGLSLLMFASPRGGERIFNMLLDKGEDTIRQDVLGATVYHYVAANNNIIALRTLLHRLENVDDLNITDKKGSTALSFAIFSGYEEFICALVEKGANIPQIINGKSIVDFLDEKISPENQNQESRAKWVRIKSLLTQHINDDPVTMRALVLQSGEGSKLSISSSKDRRLSASSSHSSQENEQNKADTSRVTC